MNKIYTSLIVSFIKIIVKKIKNMKYRLPILLTIICFIFSCNKLDHTLLHGKWKGVTISEKGKKVDKGAEQAEFNFYPNGTYTYEISYHKEAGKFRTLEDKLYTTDTLNESRIEKVVQVATLTSDSLFIKMNDKGVSQILKCHKVK